MLPYNIICIANEENDLEDKMELRLERDGQRVTLHLKKNDNVRDDVPVFTSENKVVRKLDTSKMPVSIICYLGLNVMIFRFVKSNRNSSI